MRWLQAEYSRLDPEEERKIPNVARSSGLSAFKVMFDQSYSKL
jgi:hypothetical protein